MPRVRAAADRSLRREDVARHDTDDSGDGGQLMGQLVRAWVANAVRRRGGAVVLLDWAFAGDGAVGEDLGNWLPDAVLDLFWPAERLAELEAACFPAHLAGLRESGWQGAASDVRLGVVASCVKYAWLLPLLLARAGDAEQRAYHQDADPEHLYRQRGMALAHLVGWADEALSAVR